MGRIVLKTMKLSKTLHDAGAEIDELAFHEPDGTFFDELEQATTFNANAKKRKDVIPTGLLILSHLTGVDESVLRSMTFDDRKRANELVVEVMGAKLDLGEG